MKDCIACTDKENKALRKVTAEEKAKTGPAHPTSLQKLATEVETLYYSKLDDKRAADSLMSSVQSSRSFLSTLVASHSKESVSTSVCTDSVSDESDVSLMLAKPAVLKGIGK